jgi:molybdopterin-guanine dinucleotide biosynthesis protein A/nucleoside-triphosphatase THEP1
VQSGKTTLLQKWLKNKVAAGILTPDVNGKRVLYDIAEKATYELELNENSEGIKIGKFVFSSDTFELAKSVKKKKKNASHDWLVVDEVGKLEIERKEGLEPVIAELITHYKSEDAKGNLLLVIRDYLLEKAIADYELQDAIVLKRAFFEDIQGIVLCGGKSERMGEDKAFIKYHNQAQYAHVVDLMKPFVKDSFVSCKDHQSKEIHPEYKFILDKNAFDNAGPMTGLLSAFDENPNVAILLVACDYPYLKTQDISLLMQARQEGTDVVCFTNSMTGFDEPLIAAYEKQCAVMLRQYFEAGNFSLRHFLKTVNTKRVLPLDIASIKSIDSKEDFLNLNL